MHAQQSHHRPPLLTIATRPLGTALLIILSDLVALAAATGLSLGMRLVLIRLEVLYGVLTIDQYVNLLPFLLLFLLAYAAVDLYPGVILYPAVALGPVEELRRLTVCTTLGFLAMGLSPFLTRGGETYSRAIFITAWALSLVLVPLFRELLRQLCSHRRWWGHPAVLIGAGLTGTRVVKSLQRTPGLGLKVIAVLDDDPDAPSQISGVPVFHDLDLASDFADQGVPYAIVTLPELPREEHDAVISRFSRSFPHLLIIPELFAKSFTLWAVAKDLGGILGLEVREQLLLAGPRRAKRAFDLTLTILGGICILPLLLVIALLIKLESRGPIFFTQERMGRDGETFRAFKFRTMCVGAEEQLQKILADDPALRAEYEEFRKLRDDPRVTRVGRLLRKFSLDELLQLINVLRGEMSLVGPRAYLPTERPHMDDHDEIILRVRPGITGLWQVSGRSDVVFSERLNMDVYYVSNWSLWFDLYIFARTFWVVIRGSGAC